MGSVGGPDDLGRSEAGAEAVVNVDHGQPARAGVQHAEKCSNSAKRGAVPDTGRDTDHRCADKARDHAWQRPLHPCDDHDRPGGFETAALLEKPVQTGDTNVEDPADGDTHQLGRQGRFLRNRDVGGSRRNHDDLLAGFPATSSPSTLPGRSFFPGTGRSQDDHPRSVVPLGGGVGPSDRLVLLAARPCHDGGLAGLCDPRDDPGALLGGLPLAVDDLGKPATDVPVQVDARVAEILERQGPETRHRLRNAEPAGGDRAEQLLEFLGVHPVRSIISVPAIRSIVNSIAESRRPHVYSGDAMPELFDAIVAGGGPSGSAAAHRLAAAGRRVLVLEKSPMPRDKLCGGAVSEQALGYLGFAVPDDLVQTQCFGARVHYGADSVEVRSPERVAILVSRSTFDAFLLDRARTAGAEACFETVRTIEGHGDRVVAVTDRGEHEARIAIIASGAASVLPQIVRPKDGPELTAYCMEQYEPRSDPDRFARLDGLVDIHFGISGFGYGWVFPHRDRYAIGVAGLGSTFPDPRGAMRQFWTGTCGLPEERLSPKGWPVPCGGVRRRVAADRMVLSGDAAGFVDAFAGEGIAYAIRSGQLAADTASEAMRAGDFSARFLERRIRRYYREIETDLRYSLRLARLAHAFPKIFIRLLATEPAILERYLLVVRGHLGYRSFFLWLLARLPLYLPRLLAASRRGEPAPADR